MKIWDLCLHVGTYAHNPNLHMCFWELGTQSGNVQSAHVLTIEKFGTNGFRLPSPWNAGIHT